MSYKSLTEQRRELLYLAKLGYTVDKDLLRMGSSKSPSRRHNPSIGHQMNIMETSKEDANLGLGGGAKGVPNHLRYASLNGQQNNRSVTEGVSHGISHISAKTINHRNIKEIIGHKFSNFSKEDRFKYVKASKKCETHICRGGCNIFVFNIW